MTGNIKIGLCLSGGGARGFAHLGVLQAIDDLGISLHRISGSSAGAFAAALYSEGLKPREILKEISQKSLWKYVSLSPNRWGFLSMNKTGKILKSLIPHDSFEQLKIPITVCTTNISKGVPAYFSEGPLIQSLLASASVPVAFRPIIINGDKHIDGGLSNNVPLEALSDCDFKIAVNVTPFEKRLAVKSMKGIVLKSLYISLDQQSRHKSLAADLVIEPEGIMHFDGFKLKNAEPLFEVGYKSALKSLKDFKFE